ncbi:hypothetical protein KKG83_04265 [Candidatus Micrarchaeota archaeon]|nr:hypothetical protein [Candidatus Micrarchaeota archaeon]MBU2476659.1 hypothetical protein [Candidatus Micrarchaeota archaeon]
MKKSTSAGSRLKVKVAGEKGFPKRVLCVDRVGNPHIIKFGSYLSKAKKLGWRNITAKKYCEISAAQRKFRENLRRVAPEIPKRPK